LSGHDEKLLRALPLSVRLSRPGPSALIAAASGALLSTAFVSSWTFGLWAGMVGVLYCTRLQRPFRAARTWAIFGAVFFGISYAWLSVVTWPGYLALVAYHALHAALVGLALSQIIRSAPLPLTSLAPPVWVASEFLRSRLLSGLPWLILAHPLGDKTAFVQIASITGAAGVSFLVVMVNAAVAELGFKLPTLFRLRSVTERPVEWRRGSPYVSAVLSAGLVMAACVYGTVRVLGSPLADGPRVAVLQGAVPTPARSNGSVAEAREIDRRLWESYSGLTADLAGRNVDLIVWPESSLPGTFGRGEDGEFRMRKLSGEFETPILFGTNFSCPGQEETNSAVLLVRGELAGRYDKERLVPFGEYVPPRRLSRKQGMLEPLTGDYRFGSPDQAPLAVGGWTVAANICYEDIFGPILRRHVQRGAQILVNLTNDSWFDGTAEPRQHLQAARFRAIELGVPLVRATNTGHSGIIDPYGRLTEGPAPLEKGRLVAAVKVRPAADGSPLPRPTGYARHGDLFSWTCLACVGLLALLGAVSGNSPADEKSS
jgi:apolipoprotein N-acyltransferase